MQYKIERQEEALLVILKDLAVDLSFISSELDDECRHLILDLSEFSEVSHEKLKNFVNFGKEVVAKNSFIIICQMDFSEDFPIVPTLQEAFDVIELEEIERQLDIEHSN